MKGILSALVVSVLSGSVTAQPLLVEPPEFPAMIPGPSVDHRGTGCVLIASGSITPGDVDWVQVVLPFASERAVVDVDIAETGDSALLASVPGVTSRFNIDDGNNANDGTCGLGSGSDPVGSPQDSVVELGATPVDAVINIGITGGDDAGFAGDHNESFAYEVWVFAEGEPVGCLLDDECEDGVVCTVDVCDVETGLCSNEPVDAACDDGRFCNGVETCDAAEDCLSGSDPCAPGEACDEVDGCRAKAAVSVDIRPGGCPNNVSLSSRGYLQVAFVGTADFDAGRIDISTIELSRSDGVGGSVTPNDGPPGPRSVVQDLTAPFTGETCGCASLSPDGFDDLVASFPVEAMVEVLELAAEPRGTPVSLNLSAVLLDGTAISATDCVRLVGQQRLDKASAR